MHWLYRITWEFGGNDYTTRTLASDRSWHKDVAQGHFNNCLIHPSIPLPVCIRAWTVKITKKQNGNGSVSSW